MKDGVFIGIDLGTTGTKIILMDTEGQIIDKRKCSYQILNPEPSYAEQNPLDWWNGIKKLSNELIENNKNLKNKILAVGISGQMHTQVYLDKNNQILRNAIIWMDQRSQKIVDEINSNQKNKEIIFKNTLNFLTTTYTAPHIVWVKKNQPDIYAKTKKILLAKDYIKFKLTDLMISDYSDAVGTMLFNPERKEWSKEMFDLFEISSDLMPEVDKSAKVIGKITKKAEKETSIPAGTPVINGSADQSATTLGAGVINEGEVVAIIGTAGVLSVLSNQATADPEQRILCWNYCLEDKWVNLAIMQTAGESLNWFKRTFDEDKDVYDQYNKELKNIPDGSEGLIFLPYLMGERSPYWDSDARGVFFGIDTHHSKYHFVKSIMEGVSFAFRNNMEVMESLGININELRLLGGGSKSEEWRQIMAKVLTKKIKPVIGSETGALGSSILSGLALGIYNSPADAAAKMSKVGKEYYYKDSPEVYYNNYNRFKKLYQNTKELFKDK